MSSVFFRKNSVTISLILILFLAHGVRADRKTLVEDIEDGYLDDYTKIEAAFILSGVTNSDSMKTYLNWYNELLTKIKSFSFDIDDRVGSARNVFMYLHSEWLKTYATGSTTLIDIVHKKEYNCVSATILYNIICEDLDWSCSAFETPSHVYTIFNDFTQNLMVENTSSMGFNILKNLKSYSKYLAQYYPQNEVLRIGLDKLYYYENSRGRLINNTELLGLLAYNRAYLAKKNNDYKASYEYVLLAQEFNRDSRSNVNFEIGLYYSWGSQLFSNNDYISAFSVFADGYYRYPDNEDFLKNTIASFFRSLQYCWQAKEWPESARLMAEINDLDILEERDYQALRQYLVNWEHYFKINKDQKSSEQVSRYIEMFHLVK